MKAGSSILCFWIILFLLSLGCDRSMIYDHYQRIEQDRWGWDQEVDFRFNIQDTSASHNILIQVRHTTDYPLSNLYMFVDVEGPSGQSMKDTINFILAENNGKWIGKGVGNLREIAYLYKRNTIFPDTGEYGISIEQAMRLSEIPVSEVGLRIELNQQ